MAVRLQPSAKVALELLRGPMGQSGGSHAQVVNRDTRSNIMGIPGDRTIQRGKSEINPDDDDGKPGFKPGKIAAAVATASSLNVKADETDIHERLSESSNLMATGDVTHLPFVDGSVDFAAHW